MRHALIVIMLLFLASMNAWGQVPQAFMLKPLFSYGAEGDEPGELNEPLAIALDPEGNIYIADTGNNRIQKFDKLGNFLKQVGGFGWEKEQFDRPVDVCAKTGLDVFVADYNNERIERYDKDLNYISSYYSDESLGETLQFGFPLAIDISNHGELFFLDGENMRAMKINSFGEPELSFGDFRWGEGKLDQPYQLVVTDNDNVFISDQSANRIAVYDYFGNYTGELGRETLVAPRGLTSDALGRVWIADAGNHCICLFDAQGHLLFSFGSKGQKIGSFENPNDVAVSNGNVYVLDAGNSRVQVFEVIAAE